MTAKLTRLTEDEARNLLETIRWPDGPCCPRCGSTDVVSVGGKSARPGLRRCKDCPGRKQFTVTVGTIFESSKIPLRDWVYAFARMCASKKGISAHQLHRELGITYKSAWFMCHRIRHAMQQDGTIKLDGTVEVDETYVGGKPRRKGVSKRGRGTAKTPVVALVQRDGQVRSRVLGDVTGATLKGAIREHVQSSATIMTDEHAGYKGIGREFDGGHRVVKHSAGEYSRKVDGASTNSAESHFALIKRGVYGTFHHVSKRHLQRYCDEFAFRWNHRKISDTERAVAALRSADGKRLFYRAPAG